MSGANDAKPAGFRDVFAIGEFRALWSAELLSVLGDQLARVALSVLVYDRTNSAGLTALTYALTYLPDLVSGPLLSGLADRFPRRQVMVAADLIRAMMLALMAIPAVPLPLVATLLVIAQLCHSPFQSAQAATLPAVLDGDRYVVGVSTRQITNQLGQLVGFATGGVVVALVGAHQALLIDAGTFVLSAVIIRAGVRFRAATYTSDGRSGPPALRQLREGARTIWHDPRLRSLAGLAWLVGFVIVPEGLAAPYADEIGGGDLAVGLLLAGQPAGTVVGAFVLARLVSPAHRLIALGPLAMLAMAPLIAYALRPGLVAAIVLLMLAGAFGAYIVPAHAAFMRLVPDASRGQAFGLVGSGLIAMQGIGLATGGLVATLLGSIWLTVSLTGAAGMLVAIPAATAWRRARLSSDTT